MKDFDDAIRSAVKTATQAIEDAVEAVGGLAFGGETRDLRRTIDGTALRGLRARNRNGSVAASGYDGTEIVVEARIRVLGASKDRADEYVRRVEDAIRVEESALEIEAPVGLGLHVAWVDYTLRVPRAFQVEIEVGNGRVSVEHVEGPVGIRSANGEVNVRRVEGRVSARTSNGKIAVEAVSGPIVLETHNGAVNVSRVAGTVSAKSANGEILVSDAAASVTVETINGTVRYQGRVCGDLDIGTTHGSITLKVPADSVFELDADVKVGRVHTDLPFSAHAGTATEKLHAVRLRSVVGRIAIEAL